MNPPDLELSRPYAQGLVWRLIVALLRRHGKRWPLTITETHPGGGMYHVIGLTHRETFEVYLGFNLAGSSVTIQRPSGEDSPACEALDLKREDWIGRYPGVLVSRSIPDLVDLFSEVLGLDTHKVPPQDSSAELLSWSVLAQVLSRTAMRTVPLCVESGWLDSSGYSGSHQSAWTAPFLDHKPWGSLVSTPPPDAPKDWTIAAKQTMSYWKIGSGSEHNPLHMDSQAEQRILHIPTCRLYQLDGTLERDLAKDWKKGRKLRELAWRVERVLT